MMWCFKLCMTFKGKGGLRGGPASALTSHLAFRLECGTNATFSDGQSCGYLGSGYLGSRRRCLNMMYRAVAARPSLAHLSKSTVAGARVQAPCRAGAAGGLRDLEAQQQHQQHVVTHSCTVPLGQSGRADAVLSSLFPHFTTQSPTAVKRACRRGQVLVDGLPARTSTLLEPGMAVEIVARAASAQEHLRHNPEPVEPLQVIYEDAHMACVVKPPGMPCQGTGTGTAQGLLQYSLKPNVDMAGSLRKPCHAHRLDALTGGLLLAAKSTPALQQLSVDFATPGTIRKRYVALLKGRLEGEGLIEVPLQGKRAVTRYRAEQHTACDAWGCVTTVSLWPLTGRTHQLRRHMQHMGTPILGDPRYRAGAWSQQLSLDPEDAAGALPGPRLVGHVEECADPGPLHAPGTADARPAAGCAAEGAAGNPPGQGGGCGGMRPEGSTRCSSPLHGLESTGVDGVAAGTSPRSVSEGELGADELPDGTRVSLCLWAVELWLPHPVTKALLHFQLPQPRGFETILRIVQT